MSGASACPHTPRIKKKCHGVSPPSVEIAPQADPSKCLFLCAVLKSYLRHWKSDLLASGVVFLVGLPLSIGIAIGSGVPAERAAAVGILTMAVGGIVGGLLGGSPLQVSGPAAGLIVIVQGIVQDVGWEGLYASLLIAGTVQVLSGIFRVGYLFQAITPGLLKGLLSAIGVLILTGQIYRVSGTTPPGEGYALGGLLNVVLIPTALWKSFANPNVLYAWGFVLLTLAVSYTWQRRAPAQWRFIPAPLLAVLISTLIALAWKPPLSYLQVPSNILAALHFFDADSLKFFLNRLVWLSGLILAVVASAETLVCAAAVDAMQTHAPRTNYNRELIGQGITKFIAGLLGLLPVSGVIVRSSANVIAGARTRLSTILHGVWAILFITAFPMLLSYIPQAAISGVLLYVALGIIKVRDFRYLWEYHRSEALTFLVTFLLTVGIDLLVGFIGGLIASLVLLLYHISRLETRIRYGGNQTIQIYLEGAATFIQLPRLMALFSRIPRRRRVELHAEKLIHLDHAFHTALENLQKEFEGTGGSLKLILPPPTPL